MQNITLRSHVGKDGILHLDIPVGLTDAELEVTVSLQPVDSPSEADSPQGKGWPPGFFEETFGCFKDGPLVIDFEGVFEEQEELQ
jgi:hypothetical protein